MLQCTWPNQCTKNIQQHLFVAIYLVRMYLMTDFSTPSPCTHLYKFWVTPLHFQSCVCTSWMAYFSTKTRGRTFEYRIHWKINIQKKKNIYGKINGSVGWNKHSGEQYSTKTKRKAFDTVVDLFTFHILELCQAKDILALIVLL